MTEEKPAERKIVPIKLGIIGSDAITREEAVRRLRDEPMIKMYTTDGCAMVRHQMPREAATGTIMKGEHIEVTGGELQKYGIGFGVLCGAEWFLFEVQQQYLKVAPEEMIDPWALIK